jgi:predicted outer membrane repeat protein
MLEAMEERCVPSTLPVTNNLDGGTGSLRAEIAAARSGDTIVFAASLNGQTITLNSGELLINKNVTIDGPGAGNLTISGNNASRVFEVAKTLRNVTLSGLTISDGGGVVQGGAILVNTGASVAINNSILSHNTAPQGGAINNGGTLSLNTCTLSSDSAAYGGAIFNGTSTLTITGCPLSGNSATYYGGAIYNSSGTVTISGSTLSGNSASTGGAIYVTNGTVTVAGGSNLYNNSATYGYGGGIYDYRGAVTIDASSVGGNSATTQGGGIYIAGGSNGYGTVTVKNSSSITGNTAPAGAGADVYDLGVLYLDSTSTIGVLDGQ